MNYVFLFGYFFLYSFLGWIGDTSVRSFEAGRYLPGSFFSLPICPIYGFGATLILMIAPYTSQLPFILQGIGYGLFLAGFEYATGMLILKLFHRRLWTYESKFFNFGGFTDFTHAVVWGTLALLFLRVGHPFIEKLFQSY